MRKAKLQLEAVKAAPEKMRGEYVVMNINRGRNKFERAAGVLTDLCPSIFTVVLGGKVTSYSYNDILSLTIRFRAKK